MWVLQQPSVIRAIPVDEFKMLLRMRHLLGFSSVTVVYSPTELCDTEEQGKFCTKVDSLKYTSLMDLSACCLGDFSAVTVTEKPGYELCVGPLGSDTRNNNSSLFISPEG